MGVFSFFPECGFWVRWSGSVYFVAAFSCCFRGFAGWVFLGNLWCGKMGEANTLWRKIWDACRDGSLVWFCWWCEGFNKLGLWGSSQTRKWVTFQLIFACNSWLHSLHISVSFSSSSLSLIYCIIRCSLSDGNELPYFDLLFVGTSPSRSIFPFGLLFMMLIVFVLFLFFYLILAEIWWVGFLKKKNSF